MMPRNSICSKGINWYQGEIVEGYKTKRVYGLPRTNPLARIEFDMQTAGFWLADRIDQFHYWLLTLGKPERSCQDCIHFEWDFDESSGLAAPECRLAFTKYSGQYPDVVEILDLAIRINGNETLDVATICNHYKEY
jgi:hypothetical protein